LVPHDPTGVERGRKVLGVGVDADVFAPGEFGHGSYRRAYADHGHLIAEPFLDGNYLVVAPPQTEYLRFLYGNGHMLVAGRVVGVVRSIGHNRFPLGWA
jgi:hypothetical protein